MSFIGISTLLAIHLAGAALWIGLLAGILLLPRNEAGFGARAERLLRGGVLAMPVTLASGWALAFLADGSPGLWPWAVDAMQAAGIAMGVVLLIAAFGEPVLLRAAEVSRDRDRETTETRRLVRLIAIDLLLGFVIIGFAVIGRYG
ncbi:hypothetical protein AiwAL_01235 [Acidiphilium sp. AL]|uniref:Copper resistance protein D domain-containing protein n=1 Tax=Acidiphilium iwatense TaxID=768198 RepID=A0ABS9DX97_9PROT|nr:MULTISPECIES: hypothetical protein [Acidiphilium]MCF3946758.1 hypothetical protein [Acidiphilium iwatense]MCU4158727.1 hypothetical protein [Acidiphilium sp. AL]